MRKESVKARQKLIVRKCHKCNDVLESYKEEEKCQKCGKSFLPLNYFEKVHDHKNVRVSELYAQSNELDEEDLIKGIQVLW